MYSTLKCIASFKQNRVKRGLFIISQVLFSHTYQKVYSNSCKIYCWFHFSLFFSFFIFSLFARDWNAHTQPCYTMLIAVWTKNSCCPFETRALVHTTGYMVWITLKAHWANIYENIQVRTSFYCASPRTIGGAHIATNPNHAQTKTLDEVWHPSPEGWILF